MIDRQSKIIKVSVSNRVHVGGISDATQRLLIEAAKIPNPFYERARKEGIWGEPKTIDVYRSWTGRINGNGISVPRGMLNQVCRGMDAMGYDWALADERIEGPAGSKLTLMGGIETSFLRDYQREAAEALMQAEQGIYEAPTGSGKTMTAIGLMAMVGATTLVIVNRRHLVDQWSDRIESVFGLRPSTVIAGKVSGGWRDVVVTTIQSIIDPDGQAAQWLKYHIGMVILDECHHVTALTYRDVVDRFPARYRFGLSATPERQPGLLALAEAYLGPVVAKTPRKGLLERGLLVQPTVQPVETRFRFDYTPTYRDEDNKLHRNNWGKLVTALCEDRRRNRMIADTIVDYAVTAPAPRAQLVISRNKSHLAAIAALTDMEMSQLGLDYRVDMLTGDLPPPERSVLIDFVERCGMHTVIFSTLADEALDCPKFDTIHLAYPTSSMALLTQQVGRIVRPADKQPAIVVDYWDKNVPILNEQHMRRRRAFYIPEGMPLLA